MEIKINIKKKHLYYLTGLVGLLLISIVIAGTRDPSEPFHDTLYTTKIVGNGVSTVIVEDGLSVTGASGLSVTNELTTKDLAVSGTSELKKTIRRIANHRKNTCDGYSKPIGQWDFCFLSEYGLHDLQAYKADDAKAYCQVYIDGSTQDTDYVVAFDDPKPSWILFADVDKMCGSGQIVDLHCEAQCINFG